MELNNISKPDLCKKLGITILNRRGTVVCNNIKFLFNDDDPVGMLRKFSFGHLAEDELEALGGGELVVRLYDDMSATEAGKFGKELLEFTAELRDRYKDTPPKKRPKSNGSNSYWDDKIERWMPTGYKTLDEMLDAIEKSGNWYKKVSKLGCRVEGEL